PIAVLLQEGEGAADIGKAAASKPTEAPAKAADSDTPAAAKDDAGGKAREASEEPSATKEAASVPAAPKAQIAADPDIPGGTEMVTMTVREALRDAMAEEMRRDEDVFIMGEEVAEYQGAYKITQGL